MQLFQPKHEKKWSVKKCAQKLLFREKLFFEGKNIFNFFMAVYIESLYLYSLRIEKRKKFDFKTLITELG